jgi:MATE family multidrug resistance protein
MRSLGRINREVLKLALPSILANITIPLVGMVDLAVAGHLDSTEIWTAAQMIGGIAIGSMLFDLLYWNFTFLRVGTGGLVAQAYGRVISSYPTNVRRGFIPLDYHERGSLNECGKILIRAIGVAVVIGLVLFMIQGIFLKGAFMVVNCTSEVKELASAYFLCRIWAAPATLTMMALKGWFIGMQDSVSPMIVDILVNVVNAVASILLAMKIGFIGIAAGTVVAQYSGFVCGLVIVALKYFKPVFGGFASQDLLHAFEGKETRKFFVMNSDLFVRSLCFIAVYIGYTTISARYGDLLLSSSTIMMKLLMIFSYFIDGFAYAGEAMAGKYIGAQNKRLLQSTVKYNFLWSLGVAAVFVGVYAFGGPVLLKVMTDDPSVLTVCKQFLPWLVMMPIAGFVAFTWDGIYIGATASKTIRNSMIWSVAAFYLVFFVGVKTFEGPDAAIHVLLAAYFAHLLARSIHLTVKNKRIVFTDPFVSDKE